MTRTKHTGERAAASKTRDARTASNPSPKARKKAEGAAAAVPNGEAVEPAAKVGTLPAGLSAEAHALHAQALEGYEAVMKELRLLGEDMTLDDCAKAIMAEWERLGLPVVSKDYVNSLTEAASKVTDPEHSRLTHFVFQHCGEHLQVATKSYVEQQLQLAAAIKARAAAEPIREAGATVEEFAANLEHRMLCWNPSWRSQHENEVGEAFSSSVDWIDWMEFVSDEMVDAKWFAQKLHSAGIWPPASCAVELLQHALSSGRLKGQFNSCDHSFSKLIKKHGTYSATAHLIEAFLAGAAGTDDDLELLTDYGCKDRMKDLVSNFVTTKMEREKAL